jgi:hypothetical protein
MRHDKFTNTSTYLSTPSSPFPLHDNSIRRRRRRRHHSQHHTSLPAARIQHACMYVLARRRGSRGSRCSRMKGRSGIFDSYSRVSGSRDKNRDFSYREGGNKGRDGQGLTERCRSDNYLGSLVYRGYCGRGGVGLCTNA